MGTIFSLLVVAVAFALAAMRWGYESRDGLESQEWKRREQSASEAEAALVCSPAC